MRREPGIECRGHDSPPARVSTESSMGKQYAVTLVAAGVIALAGCGVGDESTEQAATDEVTEIGLGPADGHDLSPTDIDRVSAGQMAPDFSANSLAGPIVTLSQFRGQKNVVLFFYRGHW